LCGHSGSDFLDSHIDHFAAKLVQPTVAVELVLMLQANAAAGGYCCTVAGHVLEWQWCMCSPGGMTVLPSIGIMKKTAAVLQCPIQ
jgi:hypothetical protein